MENYLPKVGEFVVGAAEEEEIIQAIVTRFPELMGSKVKKLVTGEILLRQIPPTTCIDLCGGYQMIGDAKVKWQRIIWTEKEVRR